MCDKACTVQDCPCKVTAGDNGFLTKMLWKVVPAKEVPKNGGET